MSFEAFTQKERLQIKLVDESIYLLAPARPSMSRPSFLEVPDCRLLVHLLPRCRPPPPGPLWLPLPRTTPARKVINHK